jgi:hypothetical protein
MRVLWTHDHPAHYLQGKLGLNYEDPVAVNKEIPPNWWLVDESCKYILSVLVHKDNKDISTRPTKQPPRPTRADVREKKRDGEGEISCEGTEACRCCTA